MTICYCFHVFLSVLCVPWHLALDLCSHSLPLKFAPHAPLRYSPKFFIETWLYCKAECATVVAESSKLLLIVNWLVYTRANIELAMIQESQQSK